MKDSAYHCTNAFVIFDKLEMLKKSRVFLVGIWLTNSFLGDNVIFLKIQIELE